MMDEGRRWRSYAFRAVVVTFLALAGWLAHSSFWSPVIWAVAILVATNPIVRTALDRINRRNAPQGEQFLRHIGTAVGDYQVIASGRLNTSAVNVTAEALGISGSESLALFKTSPAVIASELTNDQATELTRRLREFGMDAESTQVSTTAAEETQNRSDPGTP